METQPKLNAEFTKPECDLFRALCNFTPEERKVFDLRVTGHSIVQISFALSMSEATVNRRIKSVKKKIYRIL